MKRSDCCETCKSEPISNVARALGFHICWICNGSRARVAREAREEAKQWAEQEKAA